MSGLLGNKGPGIMGKLLARNEERYSSKEAPGFSGTQKMTKSGEWRSIDAGLDRKRRKRRGQLVGGAVGSAFSLFG